MKDIISKITIFLLTFLLNGFQTFGQITPEVITPTFDDKYSEFVKKLEAGETGINFRDFRESFIESEQFIIAHKKLIEFDSLKLEMYKYMDKSNYQEIIKITKAMLSIDYTSLIAHKILQQTYEIIGENINKTKYKTIEMGLLISIVNTGNGKTCETSWHVIQVEEEYFILEMLGAALSKQSIDNADGLCDKMEVIVKGKKKTYYFEISKVFKGYNKLGIK